MKLAVVNSCCVPHFATKTPTFDTVFGNSGNAVIYDGLRNLLPSEPHLVIPSIFSKSITAYSKINSEIIEQDSILSSLSKCDATILLLQDILRADAYVTAEQVSVAMSYIKASKNLFVFSLGSNSLDFDRSHLFSEISQQIHRSLPAHIIEFMHVLLEKALLLSVRGEITAGVLRLANLQHFHKISIDGCPSLSGPEINRSYLLDSYTNSTKELDPFYITGGLFGLKQRRTLLQMCHVAQEKHELNYFFNPILARNALSESVFISSTGRKRIFLDPGKWSSWLKSVKESKKNVYYCGTRVHGCIQALKSGIRGVLLAGDSRALEMASLYGLSIVPGCYIEDVGEIIAEDDIIEILERQLLLSGNLRRSVGLISAC
jgi:hypothetical protein